MGLVIHTLDGELDWLAHWDDLVNTYGWFSYLWEAQENLAALCARETAAAAQDLPAHSPISEPDSG